ncbi:hypothetical protein BJY52DRAFT_1165824 [Lactarius psammicola]|nr:hypothetical protein BJY52DRAFT_1165824 [Lactarius psammicola]
MSSLFNFRSARRRAKKIVSIRPPRPPTPPTPNSFVSPNLYEPTRTSAEYFSIPTYQVDVDVSHGPLFASDPFVPGIRDYRLATNSREFRGRPLLTGPGRNGAGPSKSLPDDVELEQRKNDALAKRVVSEGVTRTPPPPRRTLKATPAPIKIPTTSHASKVQIQRSAGKSAEPYGPLNPGDSPTLDDSASVVSGTTLPGALIANVWCIQTDQSRDHRLSRRITRSDSATLPSDDYAFMSSKCAELGNGVGDSDVPPVPALLPPATCRTINDLTKGQSNMPSGPHDILREENVTSREDVGKPHRPSTLSHQISPIPELSTPSPSNPVTPDLINSSTSADEGSSSQPQTSDSAPSAWSVPASSSTPPSGEEITMVLDIFSAPLPNSKLVPEMTESSSFPSQIDNPASEPDANAPSGLRAPLTAQYQPGAAMDTPHTSRSRSGSRPSLSSVNNLILHPATLFPVGEQRISSTRRVSVSAGIAQSVHSEDGDTLSALPRSLATVHSHHISQLPLFPESASISSTFTSTGFPSRSGSRSPPLSPDLLDNIFIADRSDTRRSKHRVSSTQPGSSGEISFDLSTGAQLTSRVQTPLSALSGSTQTFPETPSAFSPVFSLNNSARSSLFPDSSKLCRASITRSFRCRSSRVSQRLLIGRSVTAKASIGLRAHKKLSKSKLARQSSARFTVDEAPGGSSSVSECGEGIAATAKLSEPSLNKEPIGPRGPVVSDAFGPTFPQRSTQMSRKYSKPQRTRASIPPAPLARPPSPPPPILPPVTSVVSPFLPASPSPLVLPPSPSPQLRPPSPLPSHTPRPPTPPPAPPSDLSSEEHGAPPPYRFHTPRPSVDHSVGPLDNPLAASALPARTIFYSSDARRVPTRPPLPVGPRNPYRNPSTTSNFSSHSRFGSNSSVESLSRVTLMGARDLTNSSPSSGAGSGPKFQTSPPKYKGFTMEAAKWMFSSDDLQAIVSRAIKHSAEPSSIRLLTAQAAFTEVPAELERLTALQNELKVRYRVQARKRDVLHKATMTCVETLGPNALRTRLQELAEITANLDKIAEELYHARDQAAQLSRMLAAHSGSALAMALRKLHVSYLRRTAEVQSLQEQVFTLEAERDEAWAQAQLVAQDLDDLNETLQTRDSSPAATRPSSRTSLVMASRVSSTRVSKAGLRTSRSLRASMASQISGRFSYASSVCTPASASEVIPPVPPIPRKLSSLNRIITSDLSSRGSVYPSDLSSSSEARALAQAQADLYGYLGIDDPDLKPMPLRRSSIAASPLAAGSPGARDNARRMSDSADCRTRAGGAYDRFQAFLESEPDALLATFHHLDACGAMTPLI